MKLCRYNDDQIGVVIGDEVFDATAALKRLPSATWPYPHGDALISALPSLTPAIMAAAKASKPKAVSTLSLRSPVANPSKMIAAPLNYQLHVDESALDRNINHGVHMTDYEGFDSPVGKFGLFLKANTSLIGPSEGVEIAFPARRNDHEVELAVVIGKRCRDVPRTEAWSVIAGYAIGLDMTVRGPEDRSYRKSADTYSVLGPWLVTPDEVPHPDRLDFAIRVGNQIRQKSNTQLLTVPIDGLIEIASSVYTLYPGDIIFTGTPEGVGTVVAGDIMVASMESIGSMTVAVRSRRANDS